MARYHMTSKGKIPFTADEELEADTRETEWAAGEFDRVKAGVQSKINALFDAEMAMLQGNVVQGEINTFPTQEKQAMAYQADNEAVTPLLSGLVAIRGNGLTVAELAIRVLAHAAAYEDVLGRVMGKKHTFEDQIKTAKNVEDLNAIVVV